jgi:hypothetical protein
MSLATKLTLFSFLLLASALPAKAQTTGCPIYAESKLKSVEIFDGDPAKLFSLIPEQHFPTSDTAFDGWNFWKLGYVGDPAGFTLQCHYDNGGLVSLPLPAAVQSCREDFKQDGIVFGCQ